MGDWFRWWLLVQQSRLQWWAFCLYSLAVHLCDTEDAKASRLQQAETYIREHTALYRHYCISEVRRGVRQFTGVALSRDEAIEVVQRIRDEYSMGPIADYNLNK
jgi:hypothetical protein